MAKIVFILPGGFSEPAEANLEMFGKKWNNKKIDKLTAKFKSNQYVIIYQKDEGKIWKRID